MEYTGLPPTLVTAIEILIALAIIVIAVWRGEQARSRGADELTRTRTRRVYLCFLAIGIFVSVATAVALVSPPWLEVVGIGGGIPIGFIAIIGLFHSFMVWRVRTIQALVLATIILPGALAVTDSLPTWSSVGVAAAYGLGVIVVAARGLRRLQAGAAS